jgi:hypothetical protein
VPAIQALLFAVAAGFAVIVITTILVTIGVHHEERNRTLTCQHPPTTVAILARRVLRTRADQSQGQQEERAADHNARGRHGHCH